ncbi:hypothetical protein OKW24_003812 [Peribacillus simplex]|nr:hypothetical protein [Peribacillus simplex]
MDVLRFKERETNVIGVNDTVKDTGVPRYLL